MAKPCGIATVLLTSSSLRRICDNTGGSTLMRAVGPIRYNAKQAVSLVLRLGLELGLQIQLLYMW